MTKNKCTKCGSIRTRIQKESIIKIKDIGNSKKLMDVTTNYCNACQRHFTIRTGAIKSPYGRATKRLVKLIYELYSKGKTHEEICEQVGYYIGTTTIHEYYYSLAGEIGYKNKIDPNIKKPIQKLSKKKMVKYISEHKKGMEVPQNKPILTPIKMPKCIHNYLARRA